MNRTIILILMMLSGCSFAPNERLDFPSRSFRNTDGVEWFDINANGKVEFALITNSDGIVDKLVYDDNEDGKIDRTYEINTDDLNKLPHVILLLDSVPYQSMLECYEKGEFSWFFKPQKVISAFPSLTEVCYTELFHAPPLPGMIDTQYDSRIGKYRNDLWDRIRGIEQPWERYTHYHANYLQHGLSFLNPRDWFQAELRRAYDVIDRSTDQVTYVYFASAASMACKYGQQGIDEVFQGARLLCLKLLYERHGAIQISMMADHGHNLMPSKNVSIESILTKSGFHITNTLKNNNDVVVSMNGLVTCAAVHTYNPADVSDHLISDPSIELTMYRDENRVIVHTKYGICAIESKNGKTRYVLLSGDALNYSVVIEQMRKGRKLDAEGYASAEAWLEQTADHQYPAATVRIWDCFNRLFQSPPTMIINMNDGYCTGKPEYERWIKMFSSHGGLNQINSATFVMTMRKSIDHPLLQWDVIKTIARDHQPRVLR